MAPQPQDRTGLAILQPATPPWCRAQVPQPHFSPRERTWQVTRRDWPVWHLGPAQPSPGLESTGDSRIWSSSAPPSAPGPEGASDPGGGSGWGSRGPFAPPSSGLEAREGIRRRARYPEGGGRVAAERRGQRGAGAPAVEAAAAAAAEQPEAPQLHPALPLRFRAPPCRRVRGGARRGAETATPPRSWRL